MAGGIGFAFWQEHMSYAEVGTEILEISPAYHQAHPAAAQFTKSKGSQA